jgi:hypothetical protein
MMDFQRQIIPMGGAIWLQLIMNLVPFLGVVYNDWSVFALLYAFWLETLGMSFFDSIRIAFARGAETKGPHLVKAFRFFIGRTAVLLFYMIFMVSFVGFMVSEKQSGDNFVMYLVLAKNSFRITVITFFLVKLLELIITYFVRGEYKTALPEKYLGVFNGHIIVIHLVIVLGVFAHQFFSEKFDDHSGVVAFAGVFIIIKSLADLISNRLGGVKAK